MDPHAALGVKPGASKDDIKAAFRRAAMKCHPDMCVVCMNPGSACPCLGCIVSPYSHHPTLVNEGDLSDDEARYTVIHAAGLRSRVPRRRNEQPQISRH